jgi:hypothetical protein
MARYDHTDEVFLLYLFWQRGVQAVAVATGTSRIVQLLLLVTGQSNSRRTVTAALLVNLPQ